MNTYQKLGLLATSTTLGLIGMMAANTAQVATFSFSQGGYFYISQPVCGVGEVAGLSLVALSWLL